MTVLLSCQSISKSFGSRQLFEDLSLSIQVGDRIGLIGPNGSGKSTFLKILAGEERSDSGNLSSKRDLKIGYVPQSCEFPDLSPQAVLEAALPPETEDYEKERLAEMWLSKLGFPEHVVSASLLSGGWKKRLGLARELIREPDLLLLDEPTNHLDLEGILWLEKFLEREAPTFLLVSHDRYFLQNVVTKIVEIDPTYPKGMFAIEGPYSQFLAHKEEFIQGQLQQERSIATKARRETEWLRQGVKARTTKSQARIDEAHEILQDYSAIQNRNRQRRATIDFATTDRQTRKLVVAKNLTKNIKDRTLFRNLDFTLSPGTRMGLMGPNGAGKTTLLRLLMNEISPDQGTLKFADNLKIVYFDQHRAQLPDDMSLREALSPKGDYVEFCGQQVHVNGWCKRFLFSPDLLNMPIGKLSGGERARISIAHLMLQPADLLLLDEPTNDLDIATLETLEESLLEFPGAVVLITHDRCMLDRLCNAFLALGDPEQTQIFAEFSQWEAAARKAKAVEMRPAPKPAEAPKKNTLNYQEKKEYEQIEGNIAKFEAEVQALNHLLEEPEVAQSPERLAEVCTAIGLTENRIAQLYLRWEELEKKMNS
jgi:ATP-binding cassette subfamily F protein uup